MTGVRIMKEVDPTEVANPQEVAQIFDLVFAALGEMQKQSSEANADTNKTIQRHVQEISAAVRAARSETATGLASLRKIVDSISRWRDAEVKRNTASDASSALSLSEENAVDIENLQKEVANWKFKMPKPGKPGKIPDHEWNGTSIRFENSDGSWGEWVDLRGLPGEGGGFSVFGGGGAGMGGVRRIKAGSGIEVSGDPGEPTVSATGGTGGSQTIEEPSGAINDSNLDFTFTVKPFLINVNGMQFRENHGWSWDSGSATATLDNVVGTGGDIFGIMQL